MITEGRQTVEERIEGLYEEIAFQISEPQGEDPRIATCNQAIQEIFMPDSQLFRIVTGAFARRPDLNPVHANRLLVRSFQRHALRHAHEVGFPEHFDEVSPWRQLQTRVLEDSNMRRRFRRDMNENDVQTNHDERGKSLKLLPLLMTERFGHPLRILELGSGPNHILKKLALNAYGTGFNYGTIKVKRPLPGEGDETPELVDDDIASQKLNTLLATGKIAVRKFIGLDKDPIRKPSSIEWIRSQFYTSEYSDPSFLEKFDLVQQCHPAHVGFQRANIFDLARFPELMRRVMKYGPYDFVLFGTFMYQMNRDGIETAEWVGDQVIDHENGIKLYQDAIYVDPKRPQEIQLVEHWRPYTWRTIIEDMQNPGKKQTLFVWKNGRCGEMQIGDAELCIDNSLVKAEEVVAA